MKKKEDTIPKNNEYSTLPLASEIIRQFNHSDDFVSRNMAIEGREVIVFFLEPLIDKEKLNDLLSKLTACISKEKDKESFIEFQQERDPENAKQLLLEGNSLAVIDGLDGFLILENALSIARSSDEPSNERVIRGSHDGFVESISKNVNILRERVQNSDLTIKYKTVGKLSKTKCAIVYLNGMADSNLIQEIERRLDGINLNHITSAGIVEEFMEDFPFSPFPQILHTERPDRVVANVLDGRIGIMVHGTPAVLILPVSFFSFYQSPDDYSTRWLTGSFYRIIRVFSFFLAVCLPAIYISIISFHSEVIPRGLIILVKKSVEEIPYPPIIEAIIIELTLELLREAGIRLPNPIGQTIGIVGGLVIGDAVVRAGLVSNFMIIVVALTAISSFIVPTHEMSAAVRLVRFPLMLSAATLGFVGITYGLLFIFIHLCRLQPYGKPYFSPLAPLKFNQLKDTFIRLPMYKQNKNNK